MAILAELFLVLAGYASGISESELHPTELEVFVRASQFGRCVAKVSEFTGARLDDPVCRVIKREVSLRYLEELTKVEAVVISNVSKLARSTNLEDSLLYTAQIMSLTVDKWSDVYEFSLEMLNRLDREPGRDLGSWISQIILHNASYASLRELGFEVLKEMDVEWLNELKTILAEGKLGTEQFLDHLHGPDTALLVDITRAMHKLIEASESDPNLLESVLSLVEENEKLLDEEVRIPLDSLQCTSVLHTVQRRITEVVKSSCLQAPEVNAMLKLLRAVVLLGSASFVTDLCDNRGDTEKALDLFFEIDKEIDSKTTEMGRNLLEVTPQGTNLSSAAIMPLKIRLTRSLEFVFTQDQCTIYETLYLWLAKLAFASSSVAIGSGNVAHAYKLFFNTLWSYYQDRIDRAFAILSEIMQSNDGINVRVQQDKVLKSLVIDLFLDAREYRSLLDDAIINIREGSLEPLRELVADLSEQSTKHRMDLTPFLHI